MSGRPLCVLCVDDHALLAEGMKTRLGLESDMDVVGWIESADTLLDEAQRTEADVILLDIEMPGRDPFEVVRDLQGRRPQARVIVLSAFVRDRYLDVAVKAGAWGYVSKSDTPDDVVEAIRKVAVGEFAFGPSVLKQCGPKHGPHDKQDRPATRLERLTEREIQILRMIGKGMSRVEIADSTASQPQDHRQPPRRHHAEAGHPRSGRARPLRPARGPHRGGLKGKRLAATGSVGTIAAPRLGLGQPRDPRKLVERKRRTRRRRAGAVAGAA